MNIYTNTPYTYRISWSKTGMNYYGVRYAKDCHPSDLFVTYFTSSKYVDEYIKEHGMPDIIEVRKTFNGENRVSDAIIHESKVLKRLKVIHRYDYLNRHDTQSFAPTFGFLAVKDSNGNTFQTTTSDPRLEQGIIHPVSKDTIMVRRTDGSYTRVARNDEGLVSGKYKFVTQGMIIVRNTDGKNISVSLDDPRVKSGELKSPNIGLVQVIDAEGNRFRVPVGSSRIQSENLKFLHDFTDTVSVKNKDGITSRVSKDDPRYLSGELIPVNKGTTHEKHRCEWCGVYGGGGNMTRYHDHNCHMNPTGPRYNPTKKVQGNTKKLMLP